MHEDSTKEITTLREVLKSDLSYNKFWRNFVFHSSYIKKLVFPPISKHFKIGKKKKKKKTRLRLGFSTHFSVLGSRTKHPFSTFPMKVV